MELSAYEQRVLAGIEQDLDTEDPVLAASLRQGRVASPIRQQVPFWAGQLWVLSLLLGALALHPLLFELGVFGVGLLTVGLVLPWLLAATTAAHTRVGSGETRRPG